MLLNQLFEKHAADHLPQITIQLLEQLKVKVTSSAVIDTLQDHPDYPSLYSLSETLHKWKIDNVSLKLEFDKLKQLPVPFIAHTKNAAESFIVVTSVNGTINYVDRIGRNRRLSQEQFIDQWTNTVLLAEKNNGSGERNYNQQRRKELLNNLQIPFIVISCVGLIALFSALQNSVGIGLVLLALIKLAGCIITSLLLWFEIDTDSPLLKQVCSSQNQQKKINCNAVLGSKASKLFGWVSWSEIGFYYFTGGFLFTILEGTKTSAIGVLTLLTVFALPYAAFSVFYQWRIAKQWCPLCLIVQALLLSELTVLYSSLDDVSVSQLVNTDFIALLTSFLLPVVFWIATKKVYLEAQEAKQYKRELTRLKYNKDIFSTLLLKQNAAAAIHESLGITLGNPNASNTIIKVCNPYCGPCANAHRSIEEILENEDVKVQIIFTATNDEKDRRAKPVRHLMALYEKKDPALISEALKYWYGADKKDYNAFAKKYPVGLEMERQSEKLESMHQWSKEAGIAFTPTFFINGRQLPGVYKIEDLKYLL